MASLTAVELGTDTCAFAHTSVRRGEVRLVAADVLDPAAFPGMDAFTIAVRRTRRSMRLPRRCRAVVWGLPDGANRKDAAVKPLLAPLTNAGFRVERVVSPCNALAALARLKSSRGEGSTCWVAINRGGVAIVVVRPGKLLYAHSFAWDSSVGASGSQARLLQRYSLVSFLSPEVKRAIAEARKSGTPVDAVVTCGNLPDLRSLTMPLIEELDVEVETLDSLEGLVVKPQLAEKLAESAPAIRLACAAAIARGTRPWDPSKKRAHSRAVLRYLSAAAILIALLGVGYRWYGKPRSAAPPPFVAPALSERAKNPESNPKKPESNPPAVATKPPVVVTVPPPPAVSVQSTNAPPNPASAKATAGPPKPSAKAPESNPPVVSVPAKKPESNPPAPLNTPAISADKPQTGSTPVSSQSRSPQAGSTPAQAPQGPMPALLTDPVPKVTAILVSTDRRLATLDGGRIVGVGNVVGRRTVVAVDERSVVFEEPSGVLIRIGLGGRVLGTERAVR
jgi:outer membrane biosynthesis protein TonB